MVTYSFECFNNSEWGARKDWGWLESLCLLEEEAGLNFS